MTNKKFDAPYPASPATAASVIPRLPCAIYTRKSSEEGLEQDFNSLHAQRESCEAFVLSQKSLGWAALATEYDDGGFSGGTVERPALKRLISDIEAGLVKVIVVYKVDRLTRSLADFAKLVDLFDTMDVSFVSVTQQFNTTTSMGRLTLNVLLSFAQFEREVTGERIRDKIAASKRKGMWMGGIPPAGYRAVGRTLRPEPVQCERIPEIFSLYLQLNCIRRLCEAVRSRGWLTPERKHKRPGFGGHKPFSRSHLHRILSNPLYAGLVHHHGELHPGQHAALVPMDLWKEVQERLTRNRQGHKVRVRGKNTSILGGKLFDETGRRLNASHTTKGKKRYRYYVTPVSDPGAPIRLPAAELEREVAHAIANWASNEQQVLDAVGWSEAPQAARVLRQAKQLRLALLGSQSGSGVPASLEGIEASARGEQDLIQLRACVSRVEVTSHRIRISLDLVGCGLREEDEGPKLTLIDLPFDQKRSGMAVRLAIGAVAPSPKKSREPDSKLVNLIAKGKAWMKLLTLGGQSIEDIAQLEKANSRYVSRVINVAMLSPDIEQAIERGDHPVELSVTKLITSVPLPMAWNEQRALFGVVARTGAN